MRIVKTNAQNPRRKMQPNGISNATLTEKIRIDEITDTGTLRQTEGAHQCSKPFFGGVLGTGEDFGGVLGTGGDFGGV